MSWIGRGFDASSLDSRSSHGLAKEWAPLQKEFMVVSASVSAGCESTESIKVELSLKGGELGLLEEARHDVGDKVLGLVHMKGSPMRLPRNYVVVAFLFKD